MGEKTFRECLAEQLKIPEFKREWDSFQPDHEIRKIIVEAICNHGWTQKRLAKASGIPLHSVRKMVSADGNPTLDQIKKIANALGFRLELKFVPLDADETEN